MSNTPANAGGYLSVAQVGRMLSTSEKPASRYAVYRWVRCGVKVGDAVVRLRAYKLPRGIGFKADDVAAFLEQLQGALERPEAQAAAGRPSIAERALVGIAGDGLKRCAPELVGTYPMVSGGAGQLTRPAVIGHV